MSLQDILKRNIPEYQRGSESLDGYLEAAGEFLDGTKEAIVNIDNVHDYKNSTEFFYENTLIDRGFVVPSRITEGNKRRVLRDVAEINMKNGTVDSVIHAIRMAGLTPEIRVGWLPSPRAIRKGSIIDPVTLVESRYDITRYVYTDMLYGEAKAEADGIFFYGYRYEDSLLENLIGPLPILGERYNTLPDNPVPVEKTPYIIIRFDESEKTIVTDPSVDPETGEEYPYSTSEEFKLINEVLRYFLVENNRPTTTRVIIIVSMLPFDESLVINDDDFNQETIYSGGLGDILIDSAAIDEEFVGAGTVDFTGIVVGNAGIIGEISPYVSRFSCIEELIVGITGPQPEVYEWGEVIVDTIQTVGEDSMFIPMRGKTEISFDAPTLINIDVFGYRYYGDPSPMLLAVVTGGDGFYMDVDTDYAFVQLVYSSPLVIDHSIHIVYGPSYLESAFIEAEDGSLYTIETDVDTFIVTET